MPLVKCFECGTEVSTTAYTCPTCGATDPSGAFAAAEKAVLDQQNRNRLAEEDRRKKEWRVFYWALLIVLIIFVVSMVFYFG